jgi:hypothetical protein
MIHLKNSQRPYRRWEVMQTVLKRQILETFELGKIRNTPG